MVKVLLIDDDFRHSELLKNYLSRYGMKLDCVGDAEKGLKRFDISDPDLLLLDVMLPGKNGFDVCAEIRKKSNVPIIMLTARGDVSDRISGLELGADDYIGKPFEPRELVARIQSVLRRVDKEVKSSDGVLKFDGLILDTNSRTAKVDGNAVELTSMEYELLFILAKNTGKKMHRDELLSKLRGINATILTRSIDIMVSRVRNKIGDKAKPARFIQTIWGSGYIFVAKELKA
ncbi:response regulator transcription factor [Woeseiaceae bacterium]|jgi:DNA-binding response OmpR family regulator|nr:response regulator transcription factor [Woeseiaceae bacterium]